MKIQKKILLAAASVAFSLNTYAQEPVAEEVVQVMEGKKVYLHKDESTIKSTSYWRINQDKAVSGEKMTMNGVQYDRGLGVHAPSQLVYKVPPKADMFYVVPGPDAAHVGKIDMKILVDGKEVFATGKIHSKSRGYTPKMVAIDVKGATSLELFVDALGNEGGDHADWANAFFVEGDKENKVKDPDYAKIFAKTLLDDELPGEKEYMTIEKASMVDSHWRVLNDKGVDGSVISIAGKKFNHGIGVHAPSKLVFPIKSNYKSFVVTPGGNDSNGGKVTMKILIDGKEVYNSGLIGNRSDQKVEQLVLDVKGKKQMTLLVEDTDGNKGGDHASWAGAYFLLSGGAK
ncbi:NPCBM/NEW2 domain-containing protein [Flammeovirga sp. OC4]|uniref:NPCBM/NEW2 domain-containing protein n=1 Tax=Flammeovirga sp. OC4 TaxID=1382345 RepID=UPI00155D98CB|nr:NPCBM/NEW2 domain-containing protein [Flammeovirga sp. OC4]